MRLRYSVILLSFSSVISYSLNAQKKVWSVDDCIQYALDKNIQVQKAVVNNNISKENMESARLAWTPSLSGSAKQNLSWKNQTDNTTGSTVFAGSNGTTMSVSSALPVYDGERLRNELKKSETDYEADKLNTDIIRENISLDVLNAYLQVLYAGEQVKNSENQIASTAEELNLAEERYKLGAIANSDYLQVKSQLASEKLTLATDQSQLAINRVTLMQLMELPVNDDFQIVHPNLDTLVDLKEKPDPAEIYKIALSVKPEVKNAELNRQSSEINVRIARAGYSPDISLNSGVSTLYSSDQAGSSAMDQLKNNLSPSVMLSATIPIYQKKQIRTDVEIAKMNTVNSELDEQNIKNQLRKEIEQACLDVSSSQSEYEAGLEQYLAARESFDVASEKFTQGIMNSVDFLVQKTNFITAESTLLQSKYKLIFSYKVLDFYLGKPLSFK